MLLCYLGSAVASADECVYRLHPRLCLFPVEGYQQVVRFGEQRWESTRLPFLPGALATKPNRTSSLSVHVSLESRSMKNS